MVSNNKIYRLAKSILDFSPFEVISPNDVFKGFIANKNFHDYYNHLGSDNFIKLVLAGWGIKQGMSLPEIEDLYDKLFFANIFYTEDETYTESCDNCSGDGRERCYNCDGTGNVECDECDGTGKVECDSCKGTGDVEDEHGNSTECEDCEGSGEVECDECDGNGELTCNTCAGDGDSYCEQCDGDGELETDEKLYDVEYIVCWDQELYSRFELRAGEEKSVMSLEKFRGNKKILVLGSDSGEHGELFDFVKPDRIYCLEVFKNRPASNFHFGGSRNYAFSTPPYDLEHLIN